jgi:hypothetical protein
VRWRPRLGSLHRKRTRDPFGVSAEVAQKLGRVVVSCLWRESRCVGAELAQRLHDGMSGRKELRGECVGQRPGLAECHRDVPGVHGCVQLEAALADDRDPWTVYADCLTRILDGGSQALAQRLAGTFTPTSDLSALAQQAAALAEEVHRTAQRHQVLREDVNPIDIVFLLETLSAITLPGADGGHAFRRRYLALLLQALRAPAAGPLPDGPDPSELTGRWSGRTDGQ